MGAVSATKIAPQASEMMAHIAPSPLLTEEVLDILGNSVTGHSTTMELKPGARETMVKEDVK